MDLPVDFRSAPATLELPGASGELAGDLVAVHGDGPPDGALARLDERVSVHAASALAARAPSPELLGPVYRRPSGDVLVPTGRALVRFASGDRVDAHRGELAGAGYELEQPLGFAPQAGWVRRADGDIAEALAGLDRLRALPGVEHVEPQVLMERTGR
jgi:hypothetical protein